MSASAVDIARVRMMVAEPDVEGTAWSDMLLATYIEAAPKRDRYGEPPVHPNGDDNVAWAATYDLNAAAAAVWDDKASALTEEVDMSVDGESIARSQAFKHATSRAAHFRAMATVKNLAGRSARDEEARQSGTGLAGDVDPDEILRGSHAESEGDGFTYLL